MKKYTLENLTGQAITVGKTVLKPHAKIEISAKVYDAWTQIANVRITEIKDEKVSL